MADTTNRLAGIAYLTVDGRSYKLVGDLSWGVSKVTRETLTGMDSVHGYSEKPIPGFVSMTVRDGGDLTAADLNAMTNVTVIAELANGKMVIGRNMWSVNAQEVSSDQATIPVRFEGLDVQEA